jgi:hypothetical protein
MSNLESDHSSDEFGNDTLTIVASDRYASALSMLSIEPAESVGSK